MTFLLHLRQNWPLAAAALILLLLVAGALASGTLPTNQGMVRRAQDPVAYRRWLRRLVVLLVLSIAVLVGSYFVATR